METLPQGFYFRPGDHKYFYDGKPMTGVTTILGVIAKDNLIGWAAKMAVEYIETEVAEIAKKNNGKELAARWSDILTQAKTAHTRKRDRAASAGTDIHAILEDRIKEAIEESEGFIDGHLIDEAPQVSAFVDWSLKNNVKFLASERRVFSKIYFVAGTYDFKCIIDGKTYLGDIKTTSGIYNRVPFAQCAAYEMMEREAGGPPMDGRLVINVKKTGVFDEYKDVYVSYHYEDDLNLFLAALEIYRNLNNRFEPLSIYYKKK